MIKFIKLESKKIVFRKTVFCAGMQLLCCSVVVLYLFCCYAVATSKLGTQTVMRRISLSHPEEKFIHQFPQNMEGVWPATPLFKK